jgi:RimJ/RimL family protein N-acetyltransferase
MTVAAMEIELEQCTLRGWRLDDVESLVRYANRKSIAQNLRDSFPHPYTVDDAEEWVQLAGAQRPQTDFAIEFDGVAVGGVGFEPKTDVFRKTGEIGYWLGEPFWGRGICTEAVRAATRWGLEALGYQRIYAGVFSSNPASMRVLEKAGYEREACLKRAIYKNGKILDEVIYAIWPETLSL